MIELELGLIHVKDIVLDPHIYSVYAKGSKTSIQDFYKTPTKNKFVYQSIIINGDYLKRIILPSIFRESFLSVFPELIADDMTDFIFEEYEFRSINRKKYFLNPIKINKLEQLEYSIDKIKELIIPLFKRKHSVFLLNNKIRDIEKSKHLLYYTWKNNKAFCINYKTISDFQENMKGDFNKWNLLN
jgi:hypothetical protein